LENKRRNTVKNKESKAKTLQLKPRSFGLKIGVDLWIVGIKPKIEIS